MCTRYWYASSSQTVHHNVSDSRNNSLWEPAQWRQNKSKLWCLFCPLLTALTKMTSFAWVQIAVAVNNVASYSTMRIDLSNHLKSSDRNLCPKSLNGLMSHLRPPHTETFLSAKVRMGERPNHIRGNTSCTSSSPLNNRAAMSTTSVSQLSHAARS